MKRKNKIRRRGASTIEFALVVMAFLILTFGVLDLSVGVFRKHLLSNAARHAARQAIVRGSRANSGLGSWGPGTIDVPISANGIPVVESIRPMLVGVDPDKSRVIVNWVDGNNNEGDTVRVTVRSEYTPVISFIFPTNTIQLTASSTMVIAH